MRNRWTLAILLLMVLGVVAWGGHPAAAQGGTGILRGRVVDSEHVPVPGAPISAIAGETEGSRELARTTTAADGSYELTVPAGQQVWVHFNTYQAWWGYSTLPPYTLQAGQVITGVDFVLGPRTIPVEPTATAQPTAVPTATPLPPLPPPPGMPTTGGPRADWTLPAGLGLATGLLLAGARLRRRVSHS